MKSDVIFLFRPDPKGKRCDSLGNGKGLDFSLKTIVLETVVNHIANHPNARKEPYAYVKRLDRHTCLCPPYCKPMCEW